MSYNVPGIAVIMTKMASGNVQVVFQNGNGAIGGQPVAGDLRFSVVIPAADFTSFNTTVNGGATGASLTKVYAQDLNQGDYPYGAVFQA